MYVGSHITCIESISQPCSLWYKHHQAIASIIIIFNQHIQGNTQSYTIRAIVYYLLYCATFSLHMCQISKSQFTITSSGAASLLAFLLDLYINYQCIQHPLDFTHYILLPKRKLCQSTIWQYNNQIVKKKSLYGSIGATYSIRFSLS